MIQTDHPSPSLQSITKSCMIPYLHTNQKLATFHRLNIDWKHPVTKSTSLIPGSLLTSGFHPCLYNILTFQDCSQFPLVVLLSSTYYPRSSICFLSRTPFEISHSSNNPPEIITKRLLDQVATDHRRPCQIPRSSVLPAWDEFRQPTPSKLSEGTCSL